MYAYLLLSGDKQFLDQVASWKQAGVSSVAMDFEGEFNLHIYGEHLCLVQLYDGTSYFLVDPFKVSAEALNSFFTDTTIEKVMFSCESDAALIRKTYGVQLESVYDVRVPAMALGYMGNLCGLMDLYKLPHAVENKKKNQMDNWLNRPLPEQQIQYALGDVAQLLALKDILEKEIEAKHMVKLVKSKMKVCAKQKNPERPGWEKLPSYKFMNDAERIYAKHFFIARDTLARKRNVPAVRIMDKHVIVDLARNVPSDEAAFKARTQARPEMVSALLKAKEDALSELQSKKR